MKITNNKKILLPILITIAILAGFGTTFALTSLQDSKKSESKPSHSVTDSDHEEEHSAGTDHNEETASSITADASIKDLKADKTIDLLDDKASPDEVYLTVGQVLQFNTKDGKTHRIALGQGGTEHEHTSATSSGDFGSDEGWRVRFDKVGTYFFHDHFNPNINVLVVVYNPGAKPGI